jgi:ABC-2 type transport system permease protein
VADLSPSALSAALEIPGTAEQLRAISVVRWQIFKNSLRTMRGRLEVVSWVFIGLWFSALGLGGAIGITIGCWWMVSHGRTELLAALFWPIFAFWVFFPLVATAFTEAFDSANLLRYPLRYSAFFLVNLIYGSLDGSTIVGVLWLLGAAFGASLAAPGFAPWILFVVALFGVSNLLVVRALFSWIDRWLAQRKTREIMGILFFFCIIAFQMTGPIVNHLRRQHFQLPAYMSQAVVIQRYLPAGLAAEGISRALRGDWQVALGSAALLLAFASGFLFLLHVRMRGQYVGENFGEGVSRARAKTEKLETRSGWQLPGLSSQVAAIVEKEARYLLRSGPLLFTLIMPVVVLVIFHFGGNPARRGALARNQNLAFAAGAAYSLLLLTNMIYNVFGADGVGIQFFFMAPVRMRTVMFAKNLIHMGVLATEMCLIFAATSLLYSPPSPDAVAAVLTAVLFAAPMDLSIGNLLSLYSPKKFDYSTFGRQRAPGLTVLASFGVQAFTIAIGVVAYLIAKHYGSLWVATAIFAVLAVASLALYRIMLGRVDQIALRKRESLIEIIAKTG